MRIIYNLLFIVPFLVPLCVIAQSPSAPTGFRISTSSGDIQPPSIPMNLQAKTVSSSQIDLTWDASNDNTGVAGYRIIRNDSIIPGIVLTNGFSDTNLSSGTYTYVVVAEDASGNVSEQSSAATATVSNTAFLVNLNVASNGIYLVVENGLQPEVSVYTDRDFNYTSVPSSVLGATYIRTANDDKLTVNSSFLRFDVTQDVEVLVAYDERILTKPAWLATFADTGEDLVTNDTTLRLHSRDFTPGTVTLGGNEGGMSMYTVIVKERSSGTLKQCSDGLDNDGDGLVDYPADPGCASTTDNDEFNSSTNCLTGKWSATNTPPVNCTPYPNGYFVKKLPNGGKGGPVNNLKSNSKEIVSLSIGKETGSWNGSTWLNWGRSIISTPGASDVIGVPTYYGRASDPIYKVVDCKNPGRDPAHNPVGMTFHIPNKALFSSLRAGKAQSDSLFSVWDQVSNKVLGGYLWQPTREEGTLQNCTAKTKATACPMVFMLFCSVADYSTDKGYDAGNGASDSLGTAPQAMNIRVEEWMKDEINHAIYLNTFCESDETSFPGKQSARRCSTMKIPNSPLNRPPHGALFFVDYTNAQIDSMNLPPWQTAVIRALANYGGYVGDTGGQPTVFPSRFESGQAYEHAGIESPIYTWLEGQGVPCMGGPKDGSESKCRYSLPFFGDIPLMIGPKCPTKACGIKEHLHVADECVAKGIAGIAGGCR